MLLYLEVIMLTLESSETVISKTVNSAEGLIVA